MSVPCPVLEPRKNQNSPLLVVELSSIKDILLIQSHVIYVTSFLKGTVNLSTLAIPLPREPRQVNISQRPDGTIVASFAASQAFDAPGVHSNNALSQTFEIGRNGASSSGSSAFNNNILGNEMSFANSQAQASRFDPFGGGFSSSAANAAANSFKNPMFSGSNAQANAFGNQFGMG
ncbi:hypothetical protein Ocin01_01622 [Orchesella cincta]|uniref:Uncharacterized protein n=1 Tax=Orchesella cincta TaxID=48709 RepID=A0A1D2NJC4_ORCCI|nr:hypothetical protein Ocin01_01622 [Orchesella cincta]